MGKPLKYKAGPRIGQVITCTRCGNEPAIQRVKSERLGANCLQARRKRQAKTAVQPHCPCGNVVALGHVLCRTCQLLADIECRRSDELTYLKYSIDRASTVEDIKSILHLLLERIEHE